jgi:hypothetical protein
MNETLKNAKPSGLALRDELEAMVLKELLGPGSEQEEIIESPGTRYFVGVLAPRKRAVRDVEHAAQQPTPKASGTTVQDDDEDEADGEILDGDELALGGRDNSQDGTTDQAPAQDRALIRMALGIS